MKALFFSLAAALAFAGLSGCDAVTTASAPAANAEWIGDGDGPGGGGNSCGAAISVLSGSVGQHVRIRIDNTGSATVEADPNGDGDTSDRTHKLMWRPAGGSWNHAMYPQTGWMQNGQIATFPYKWGSSGFSVQYRLDTPCGSSTTKTSFPVVNQ